MSLDPGTAQPAATPPAQPSHTQVKPWEEYQLFVDDTQRATERRQAVNNIYLSVNSLLLGAVALLVQLGGLDKPLFLPIVILIAVAGLFICGDWRRLIKSYRAYLNLRFDILRGMEDGFDNSVQMYHKEASKLGYSDPHHGFYKIEINLPIMFGVLYVVGALILIAATIIGQWGAIAPFLRHTFNLPV